MISRLLIAGFVGRLPVETVATALELVPEAAETQVQPPPMDVLLHVEARISTMSVFEFPADPVQVVVAQEDTPPLVSLRMLTVPEFCSEVIPEGVQVAVLLPDAPITQEVPVALVMVIVV